MTMGDHLLLLQQQQHVKVAPELEPGFRFHPTDEELIICYLTPKVLDGGFCANAIGEVDLNQCEPWELPGKAKMGEKEWYFFGHKDRKYPTGMRTNRATNAGHWKATGKDKEIYRPSPVIAPVLVGMKKTLIGMKKTLVFYKGRAPRGEKTNWVMHEYRLEGMMLDPSTNTTFNISSSKDEWVVCRIFEKSSGIKKALAPSYAMAGAMMNAERINNPMAMPMPMPTMGEQGFTLNSIACTLPPFMDDSSLYGATAGATSLVAALPALSYGQLVHASSSMGSTVFPVNVGNYSRNNQMDVAMQAPTMFYHQQPQLQIGEEGFMEADPMSGPSSMVSQEDISVLNNKEQNNATDAIAATAEISSLVDMGMDGMWKY